MVRSPLTAARATFALKAAEWFRRGRLLMVSPVHGDYRRCQAEIPLIVLSKFPRPALSSRSATRQLIAQLNRKSSFDHPTCKEWFGDFSVRGSLFIRSGQRDKLVSTIQTAPKILDI